MKNLEDEELELSDDQIERNDEIDNAVHHCLEELAEKKLEWDMQIIGEATDSLEKIMGRFGISVRHPGICEREDGTQYIDEYDGSKRLIVHINILNAG
jgi:hypothetical protein